MESARTRVHQPLQATFRDGFGTRHDKDGADGPLEILVLHEPLAGISSLEFLVRERMHRVAHVRHECFARAHDITLGEDGASNLALVSDRTPGVRLSRMLAVAEQNLLPLGIDAALCLIRQLVSAVALMHEAAPDVCHGALATERIVITPDARLVIVEHVLGAAIEQLQYSRDRYWSELHVVLPIAGESSRLTRGSDVAQIGVVALALLLGRPLADDEYPSSLASLARGTFGLGGNFEPIPEWLVAWLSQALCLDPTVWFASAVDARNSFEAGLASSGYVASQGALSLFLAEYARLDARVRIPSKTASTPRSMPTATPAPPPERKAIPVPEPTQPPAPTAAAPPPPPVPAPEKPAVNPAPVAKFEVPLPDEPDEEIDMPNTQVSQLRGSAARRSRLIAAAVVLVALTSGGALAARSYFAAPSPVAPSTGTLAVATNPAGARVVIDGLAHGNTPINAKLNPGPHTLDLSMDGVHRTITVNVTANAEVSQFIEMPKAAPALGELDVRTDPSGARVRVDGQMRGVSPLTVNGLAPGNHMVVLENDLGSVNEEVSVQAGATASLVVPMKTPQGAPVSGWISIFAPAEVQVFENQRLLGSSRTDRIMVAAGRHDVEFANEALGFHSSQTIQVAPGQVAKVKPEWPQGTIAINATPWANVTLDGQDLGETPVGNTQVPIGTHEVVFRHPQLGEQRFTATVTATTPTRLSVDMRKK